MITTILISLAVSLVLLLTMHRIMTMAMRSYSRQAAIVTERRKKRKLP